MPEIVEHISLVTGVIGGTVILWGVLLGVLRLVRLKWASLSGRDNLVEGEDLRHHLGLHPGGRRTPASPSKFRRDDDPRREKAFYAERSR
jgi:hypothetical protein